MMLVDYHMHTAVSPDGEETLLDYVRRAEEMGLDEICFTEHLDFYPDAIQEHGGSPAGAGSYGDAANRVSCHTIPSGDEIRRYLKDVREVAEHTRVRLRAGLEVDFKPEADRWVRDLIPSLELDFALGSVHNVGPWGISGPADLADGYFVERGVEQGCLDYLEVVEQAVATGLFDSLAHVDIVKRFVPENGQLLLKGRLRDAVVAILDRMATADMAIEVNSAGLFHAPKEQYPSLELLRLARDRGIRAVTLGSDAHQPGDLARGLDDAAALARAARFARLRTFEKRVPIARSL